MTAASSPAPGRGVVWARRHLFRTWYDSLITFAFFALFGWALVGVTRFLFTVDYTILRRNLTLFVLGRFPRDQLWRPVAAVLLVSLVVGVAAGALTGHRREVAATTGLSYRPSRLLDILRRFWPALLLVMVLLLLTETIIPTVAVLAAALLGVGGNWLGRRLSRQGRRRSWLALLILPLVVYALLSSAGGVGWEEWGGLQLNLFLTLAGILFAFPLGLLLALGRRSSFPVVRTISVAYIEFIRGVPLITLLLMGMFALGFFLPSTITPERVTRVLIALTLFEAAYIAEVVRGGLQAVPKGQVEAAQAVGLTPWKVMRLVVLPQALRATIPAMVGQFISLYKDTTLVAVVGLPDVLSVAQNVNSQPDFLAQGLERLTLPFAALVFWVGSYTMSREARRLERRLGVGER
ncbi:MAG TPA: amino acid ABC transporter permease [Acidimicrobiia bacterium]|nr:amino acid ABC transporter permease [Acidimicrobiia bacterium]